MTNRDSSHGFSHLEVEKLPSLPLGLACEDAGGDVGPVAAPSPFCGESLPGEESEASTEANQRQTEGKIVLMAPRPWRLSSLNFSISSMSCHTAFLALKPRTSCCRLIPVWVGFWYHVPERGLAQDLRRKT